MLRILKAKLIGYFADRVIGKEQSFFGYVDYFVLYIF